jgi:hypothetical protein
VVQNASVAFVLSVGLLRLLYLWRRGDRRRATSSSNGGSLAGSLGNGSFTKRNGFGQPVVSRNYLLKQALLVVDAALWTAQLWLAAATEAFLYR